MDRYLRVRIADLLSPFLLLRRAAVETIDWPSSDHYGGSPLQRKARGRHCLSWAAGGGLQLCGPSVGWEPV